MLLKHVFWCIRFHAGQDYRQGHQRSSCCNRGSAYQHRCHTWRIIGEAKTQVMAHWNTSATFGCLDNCSVYSSLSSWHLKCSSQLPKVIYNCVFKCFAFFTAGISATGCI